VLPIFAGIPGVELFESGTGLVEKPGGRFAGSRLTITPFEFVFAGCEALQAPSTTNAADRKIIKTFFDIKKTYLFI
jgi:hypothetical protein